MKKRVRIHISSHSLTESITAPPTLRPLQHSNRFARLPDEFHDRFPDPFHDHLPSCLLASANSACDGMFTIIRYSTSCRINRLMIPVDPPEFCCGA